MRGLQISRYTLASATFWCLARGVYLWPNEKLDEFENLLFEQQGYKSENFGFFVDGCLGAGGFGTGGRSFGAEWLRNAYHDMATADVGAGTGGLDGSIVFEMDRAENPGKAFSETLTSLDITRTTRKTIPDLFAYGTVIAMQACSNGTLNIPLRTGRVEATGPGPLGVPEPQQDIESHTQNFARQGFNATEMIALVACGHSIGGIHGVDFPDIVPITNPNTDVDDNVVAFDTTKETFDNAVATEFVANISQNPLAFGHNETTRSDFRIFNSDGGETISQLAASQSGFLSTCNKLFERMINTVPRGVTLSDVVTILPVKPRALAIDINSNGTMTVSATIRILGPLLNNGNSRVLLHFTPRLGSPTGEPLPVATGTFEEGHVADCLFPNCGGAALHFYDFEAVIPVEQGVSSFTVEIINLSNGRSRIFDNQGQGFPLTDTIQVQASASSFSSVSYTDLNVFGDQLNLTISILDAERFTNVTLTIPYLGDHTSIMSPWSFAKIPMVSVGKIEGTNYTLFSGLYRSNPFLRRSVHPFDIEATGPSESVSNKYISWNMLQFGGQVDVPGNIEF